MRAILILATAALVLTATADAKGPASDWVGVYKHQFQNGNVQGDKYQSEDIMEIVQVDQTHAYVRLALEFYNGHSCSFAKVMGVEADALVYRGKLDKDVGDSPCVLSVKHAEKDGKTSIVLDDKDDVCRLTWCGARGSFTGETWPVTARRDIRYMDRLKASREYKDALAEAGLAPAKP